MAWEHKIAEQLNGGKRSTGLMWFSGEVLSPVLTVGDKGQEIYSGPLRIRAFGGESILEEDRLYQLAGGIHPHDGLKVALLGAPFDHAPGSQAILILGVME